MKTYSIKTKMAVVLSLLVVLIVCGTALSIFYYFANDYKRLAAEQEYATVTSIAREVDDKLGTMVSALAAESGKIDAGVLADPNAAQALLDSEQALLAMFDNHIYLFGTDGKIIAESPLVADRRGKDYSYRDYFQQALTTGRPTISEPYISTQWHRHPAIMITVPVFDKQGNMVAILAGSLDMLRENFLGELSRTKIGQTGYLYLFNTKQTVIVHPDIERIFNQKVPPGVTSAYDRLGQGLEGTAETVNDRGTPMLSSVTRLKVTDWYILANEPLAEVYKPIARAGLFLTVATVLGAIILLLVIWRSVGIFITPLVTFTKHVAECGSKKEEERFFRIDSRDEVGALANAFNSLLQELDLKSASLRKSEELYRTLTEFAADMVFWLSPTGALVYVSPFCQRLTGYSVSDFFARPGLLHEMVHIQDRSIWRNYLAREQSVTAAVCEFRIIAQNGELRWVHCVSRHVYNEQGEYCGIRGCHQDITERILAEEQLRHASQHDFLTGLRNRKMFEADLLQLEAQALLPVGILVCDVDGLKFVNDTLGHHAGDELLKKVALIIAECLPPGMNAYRIGGDEFVIVVSETSATAVEELRHNLLATAQAHNKADNDLPLSISVGAAVSGSEHFDSMEVFKEADDNMYREKLHHSQSVRSATVIALTKALEVRDFCTEGHADRMQDMAVLLGRELGMNDQSLSELRLLAQFHDIGKVGIPDRILFKPGALTQEEREVIRRHSEIGYRIAVATPDLAPIAELILKHHEWWDGRGYPLGLSGKDIPVECRILGLVDAYDAMTNDRPYRKGLSANEAILEIKKGAGSQFDPELAQRFISLLQQEQSRADGESVASGTARIGVYTDV